MVVVLWVYALLAVNWATDPVFVAAMQSRVPFLKQFHEALWPYVHRPYRF